MCGVTRCVQASPAVIYIGPGIQRRSFTSCITPKCISFFIGHSHLWVCHFMIRRFDDPLLLIWYILITMTFIDKMLLLVKSGFFSDLLIIFMFMIHFRRTRFVFTEQRKCFRTPLWLFRHTQRDIFCAYLTCLNVCLPSPSLFSLPPSSPLLFLCLSLSLILRKSIHFNTVVTCIKGLIHQKCVICDCINLIKYIIRSP